MSDEAHAGFLKAQTLVKAELGLTWDQDVYRKALAVCPDAEAVWDMYEREIRLRMAACWKACAGVPTEALVPGSLRGFLNKSQEKT